MRIRILQDKDHWPMPRRMLSFKKGTEQTVKREIGEVGVKEGWAEEIDAPRSPQTEGGAGAGSTDAQEPGKDKKAK